MAKKILLAFDDSENAMRAVEHVAKLFTPAETRVVLFSVFQDTASLCDMHSPELTDYFKSQQSSFCIMEEKKKSLVRDAMTKATQVLKEAGFDEKRVEIKTQVKKKGIARDIAKEAQNGYDLIVMGRRGLSGIREFFLGSISQKVLALAEDMSVLMVR